MTLICLAGRPNDPRQLVRDGDRRFVVAAPGRARILLGSDLIDGVLIMTPARLEVRRADDPSLPGRAARSPN